MNRVRIVSFNVCGIKNILHNSSRWSMNSFDAMFSSLGADIVCFQETKIQTKDIDRPMAIVPGWHAFFSSSTYKRGYSGVAVYVKDSIGVVSAEEGITGWLPSLSPMRERRENIGGYPAVDAKLGLEIDGQGRAITLDLGSVVVIVLYCPANSQGNMSEFREIFWASLDQRVRNLIAQGRELIVLGDLNVWMDPRDCAPIQHELKNLPKEERDTELRDWTINNYARKIVSGWMSDLGMTDTAREFNPKRDDMFTCWSQLLNSRPANYGSRVDYILADSNLVCKEAGIMPDLEGSDHCPVYADFTIPLLPPMALPELGRRLKHLFGADIKNAFSKVTRGQSFPTIQKQERPQQKKSRKSNIQRDITQFWGQPKSIMNSPPASDEVTESNNSNKAVKVTDYRPEEFPMKASSSGSNASVKKAWSDIFYRQVPKCLHNEPCKLVLSKKPGPNKGRSFWSCARPTGAVGDKDYRCKFFRWA